MIEILLGFYLASVGLFVGGLLLLALADRRRERRLRRRNRRRGGVVDLTGTNGNVVPLVRKRGHG